MRFQGGFKSVQKVQKVAKGYKELIGVPEVEEGLRGITTADVKTSQDCMEHISVA